jgi:hypothetical protein
MITPFAAAMAAAADAMLFATDIMLYMMLVRARGVLR